MSTSQVFPSSDTADEILDVGERERQQNTNYCRCYFPIFHKKMLMFSNSEYFVTSSTINFISTHL